MSKIRKDMEENGLLIQSYALTRANLYCAKTATAAGAKNRKLIKLLSRAFNLMRGRLSPHHENKNRLLEY